MLSTSLLAVLPFLASALAAPLEGLGALVGEVVATLPKPEDVKPAQCQHGVNNTGEGQKFLDIIDRARTYDLPLRVPCHGIKSEETCVWVDVQISAQKDGVKEGKISGETMYNGIKGLMDEGGDDGSACLSRDGTYEFQLGTPTSET